MLKPIWVAMALLSAGVPTSAAAAHAAADADRLWSLEAGRHSGGMWGSGLWDLEYGTARSDHAEVAQAVARCDRAFTDPVSWSASTRAVLLFELNDTLSHGVQRPGADEKLGDVLHLTAFQAAAISFSDKLSRNRLSYRYEIDTSRAWALWLQVAAVVLGALATIFIGIRSLLQQDSRYVAHCAALAISCSAFSTAVATLNTFGDFHTTELRSSKTLAQLQQLHWRVVSDVLKNNLVCSGDQEHEKDKASQVGAWRDRYEAIRDTAVESLARPGDLSTTPAAPEAGDGEGKAGQKERPTAALPKAPAATRTSQR